MSTATKAAQKATALSGQVVGKELAPKEPTKKEVDAAYKNVEKILRSSRNDLTPAEGQALIRLIDNSVGNIMVACSRIAESRVWERMLDLKTGKPYKRAAAFVEQRFTGQAQSRGYELIQLGGFAAELQRTTGVALLDEFPAVRPTAITAIKALPESKQAFAARKVIERAKAVESGKEVDGKKARQMTAQEIKAFAPGPRQSKRAQEQARKEREARMVYDYLTGGLTASALGDYAVGQIRDADSAPEKKAEIVASLQSAVEKLQEVVERVSGVEALPVPTDDNPDNEKAQD